MARVKAVNPPIPALATWETPGAVVFRLELDANEAEAVRSALYRADFTRREAELAHGPRPLPSTSLCASGARVHEALVKAGAR